MLRGAIHRVIGNSETLSQTLLLGSVKRPMTSREQLHLDLGNGQGRADFMDEDIFAA